MKKAHTINIFALSVMLLGSTAASSSSITDSINSALSEVRGSGGLSLTGGGAVNLPSVSASSYYGLVSLKEPIKASDQNRNVQMSLAGAPTQRLGYIRHVDNVESYVFSDSWNIGNGWFGANTSYHVEADSDGNIDVTARTRGTILGVGQDIVKGDIWTRRRYNGTYSTSDDKLVMYGSVKAFGQTTKLFDRTLDLGWKTTSPGKTLLTQPFFHNTWYTAIGIIPITIKANLTGYLGYLKASAEFSHRTGNEIYASANITPYASVNGTGSVGLGWWNPNRGSVPIAKGVVEVAFLRGSLLAQANANSGKNNACYLAKFNGFKALDGSLYGYARWSGLNTTLIKDTVSQICDNGYISLPGCGKVKNIVSKVQRWTTYEQFKYFYKWDGIDLGNKHNLLNQCRSI